MRAHEFANVAAGLVNGDRSKTHGEPRLNCQNIAALWSAYVQAKYRSGARVNLNAEDVAHMMNLLKIARSMTGCYNPDDYIDSIGYAGIAGEIAHHDATHAMRIVKEEAA